MSELNNQDNSTILSTADTPAGLRAQQLLNDILALNDNYEAIFGLEFETPNDISAFEKDLTNYINGTAELSKIQKYVVTAQDYSTLRDNLVILIKRLQDIESQIFSNDGGELTYSYLYNQIKNITDELAIVEQGFNEKYNNGTLKIDTQQFKISRDNLSDEYNNPLTYSGITVKFLPKGSNRNYTVDKCYYIEEI